MDAAPRDFDLLADRLDIPNRAIRVRPRTAPGNHDPHQHEAHQHDLRQVSLARTGEAPSASSAPEGTDDRELAAAPSFAARIATLVLSAGAPTQLAPEAAVAETEALETNAPTAEVPAAEAPAATVPDADVIASPTEPTLGARERDILDFERRWWRHAGAKEQAIREQLKISPTRYYQTLNLLLESAAALAYDPVLVQRLRRLRASRFRARSRG